MTKFCVAIEIVSKKLDSLSDIKNKDLISCQKRQRRIEEEQQQPWTSGLGSHSGLGNYNIDIIVYKINIIVRHLCAVCEAWFYVFLRTCLLTFTLV